MSKVYYYAVAVGRHPGVYSTWAECEREVKGYPNAKYKKFSSENDAYSYVNSNGQESENIIETNSGYTAYVDGSYKDGEFSCGVVILDTEQNVIQMISKRYNNPELASMHNVAGEIKGSEVAIQWAIDNNIPTINICHDYEGIGKWATGEWKARTQGTKDYVAFCSNAFQQVSVTFQKVKAHSNVKHNETADKLAKAALGIIS